MNKKTLYRLMLVPAVLAAAASCGDYRNEYMEDYQTMVYFRNGGEQNIALYSTGEDGLYSIPVCKGGRNLSGTITAELVAFDDNRMALYNAVNLTNYAVIPASMYTFLEADGKTPVSSNPVVLEFGADDYAKVVTLRMKTGEVNALMQAHPGKEYVMGFQLFSEGKVSDGINLLLLAPQITVPYLQFSVTGVESHAYDRNSPLENEYTNRVKFGIDENRWDFTCELEVKDAAWLAAYNASHGTDYDLLPSEYYELPSSLEFGKGRTEVPFTVTVKRDGMPKLRELVIPVAIKASSKAEFVPFTSSEEDEYVYMLQVLMNSDTPIPLSVSQITASYAGLVGYQTDKLVDDDESTFWSSPGATAHSKIGGDLNWGFYFDIKLSTPLSVALISYLPNVLKPERSPTRIRLAVSDDGENYTVLKDVAEENMRYLTTWNTLPLIKRETPFSYIRIALIETFMNGIIYPLNVGDVNMTCEVAEIKLYGSEN